MGFSREEVLGALRENDWDPERALDRLEGEDEFIDDEDGGNEHVQQDDQLVDAIERFLTDPQFADIRRQIRENPDQIGHFLEQLQVAHPQLHATFTSDPQIITQVLEEVLEGSVGSQEDEWIDDQAQGGNSSE